MSTQRAVRLRRSWGVAPIAWIAIALYCTFLLFPLARSVILSFTDRKTLANTSDFVGLDNYVALTHDQRLADSLLFTFLIVVVVTLVANVVGLAFAMLLNRPTVSFRVMRTLIFIPQVLSGVIIAFIWRTILSPNGLLNNSLADAGVIAAPINWLGDHTLATVSICAVVAWMTIAFTTVVYTASLQSIPPELYEAVRMDGAGWWKAFRHITFPMIAPGMTISVTLLLITTFKLYDVVLVLTGGGPANSTRTTAFYLIWVAFEQGKAGYAAAVAVLLLAITAGVAYSVTALLRRREALL